MGLIHWLKKITHHPIADVAESAMIRQPGAWLKKKLDDLKVNPKTPHVVQSAAFPQRGKNLSDEEIEKILEEAIQGATGNEKRET